MIDVVIPIVRFWLPMWYYLLPLLALCFVATVPCLIRGILRCTK